MYQNYSYYPPQQQQNRQMIPGGLKGRPVSSLEEVKATAVDFDGSIFFFPDLANKRIYTKQINMDGSALLNMYELKEIPIEQNNNSNGNYITREEFETSIAQLRSMLEQAPPQTKDSSFNF